MKKNLTLVFLLLITLQSMSQLPKVTTGTLVRVAGFQSKYIDARNIDIWLPEGFDKTKKYPVLYMHDGQALYDAATTWNHQSWDVDDAAGKLISEKKIRQVIVVGIWNGGKSRHADYLPQKPYESLPEAQRAQFFTALRPEGTSVFNNIAVRSDDYLKFIVFELKPYIDKTYPTLKGRKDTFIAGSSMGGMISLYAICEYPGVFGGAACLSTHWPGIFTLANNPFPDAMIRYLTENLPKPSSHKIYFDHGTTTLDSLYPAIQVRVDAVMKSKKFAPENWNTREFKGANHSEDAWKSRLETPLVFLLRR